MLSVTENGTVTAMKKEGSGSLDISSVEDMLEVYMLLKVNGYTFRGDNSIKMVCLPSEKRLF